MLNKLDPDQAQNFVEPDLDPNCLQSLSADDTCKQRVFMCSKPTCLSVSFSCIHSVRTMDMLAALKTVWILIYTVFHTRIYPGSAGQG